MTAAAPASKSNDLLKIHATQSFGASPNSARHPEALDKQQFHFCKNRQIEHHFEEAEQPTSTPLF
jgi:hypothetical protein